MKIRLTTAHQFCMVQWLAMIFFRVQLSTDYYPTLHGTVEHGARVKCYQCTAFTIDSSE